MAKIKLTVGGFDFVPYLAADGLTQSEIIRQEKTVVGLDGTLYKFGVKKAGLTVSLGSVRDDVWQSMRQALAASPATVLYTDTERGDREASFYVSSPTASAKRLVGGVTWYSGAGFTLEEV